MFVDVLVNWCLYRIKLSLRGKYFFLWCRVLPLLSHSITFKWKSKKRQQVPNSISNKQTNLKCSIHKKEGKCEEKNLKNILKTFRCQPSESDRSSPLVLFAQDQALETAIHHWHMCGHFTLHILPPDGHCFMLNLMFLFPQER